MAVNIVENTPELSVVAVMGVTEPRRALFTEKWTGTPIAGNPFNNTWPERVEVLFACSEVHTVFGTAFMVIVADGGLGTLFLGG
ncbi:hypothetical protein [Oceanobacillus rekensis]|uniref:hypothetical protein n=1 Tax=Oceanobacillus rekensis TaxID=937927 RepID=UPI0015938FF9|nr:hypothetical protein [Oceanobacillus rekensis]